MKILNIFNLFFGYYIMKLLTNINKSISNAEKMIGKHLSSMGVSCHRVLLFDSLLWLIFIVYYIGRTHS